MLRLTSTLPLMTALALAACGDAGTPASDAPEASVPAPATTTPSVDPELAQLQAMTPVDACAWLTPDKLKAVYPDLEFVVHQHLPPRLSGYAWDTRCTYWAGVGTIEFAKDVPTHTVEVFVAISATAEAARARFASRREGAQSTTGYQPQPELAADAYATTNTGVASLYFVRDQSEVQINVSDLSTPNDEKLRKAVALAQTL